MIFFLKFLLFATALTVCTFVGWGKSINGALDIIAHEDPLKVVIVWASSFALSSFVAGLVVREYSWVDRLWSTLPVCFVLFYAWRASFNPTMVTLSTLVTLWGMRLTFNFARKGGYSSTEDYRWSIIKKKLNNSFLWQLFHFFFICGCQVGLFVLFTYPVYCVSRLKGPTPNIPFFAGFCGAIGMLVIETTADQQQWNFQNAKHKDPKSSPDAQRGFLTHGLFAYSRHPNYFGEIGFWWCIWTTSMALIGNVAKSGIIGPLSLTALFCGSTIFTESISSSKYPQYKKYQHAVSPIIPFFHRELKFD